ncbi:MAG: HNH endonuclease, partial [Acidobacteriota bacterium]
TYDDNPKNGMALCKLCHWSFDEGMLGVSNEYVVLASPQLTSTHNIPGHLPTLLGRIIIGPEEKVLWPDLASLTWHRKEKFRRR